MVMKGKLTTSGAQLHYTCMFQILVAQTKGLIAAGSRSKAATAGGTSRGSYTSNPNHPDMAGSRSDQPTEYDVQSNYAAQFTQL